MTVWDLHRRLEDLIMSGHEDLEVVFDEGAVSRSINSVSVEEYFNNKGGKIVRVVMSEEDKE
jgi:hypothetical protein